MITAQPNLQLTTAEADRLLAAWLGGPVACTGLVPLEGGMINSVFRLDFDREPGHAVVKLHGVEGNTFATEARSLEYLAAETACPVPAVYLQDSSGTVIDHAVLLLAHVPGVCLDRVDLDGSERADIDEQLAAVLAELHRHTGTRWGAVDRDEGWTNWADLFESRLRDARAYPALEDRLSAEVLAQVDDAIEQTAALLGSGGTPTLVHGDIWDGNLMARREDGRWKLTGFLDPDLQFADPELELAYLEVFDNERPEFFAAYGMVHQLRPGYERRRLLYWLHTGLVHVALFEDEFFCQFTARTAAAIGRLR